MHPELQVVYSPVFRNSPNLQLSIFQDGKGYYGKYRGSDADFLNVSEKFGAKLHAAVKGMNFKAGLEYKSLFAGQTGNVGMMNSARGEVGKVPGRQGRFQRPLCLASEYGKGSVFQCQPHGGTETQEGFQVPC